MNRLIIVLMMVIAASNVYADYFDDDRLPPQRTVVRDEHIRPAPERDY